MEEPNANPRRQQYIADKYTIQTLTSKDTQFKRHNLHCFINQKNANTEPNSCSVYALNDKGNLFHLDQAITVVLIHPVERSGREVCNSTQAFKAAISIKLFYVWLKF